MTQAVHHHRPTLKQQNKHFKSKHATKSSLKEAAKGRSNRQSPKAAPTSNSAAQSRLNRRNNSKQAQIKKRQSLISATRIFGGVDGAPRIVAVIPLTEDVSARDVASTLAKFIDESAGEPQDGPWRVRADRFKTSLQFLSLPYKRLYAALDACKAADYVVFVLSSEVEVNNWGDTLLRTLQAHGLPEIITVVAGPSPMEQKEKPGIMKSLLSFIQYFAPSQSRVFDMHSGSDALNAVRTLCEGRPADVKWRDGRSWILGERVDWQDGTLSVTGVVRGASLSADQLVHLPNYGDYQVSKIMSAPLPRQFKLGASDGMEIESALLAEPSSSDADSLVSSNDPDDMANEQTWPTEEELKLAPNGIDMPENIPEAQNGTTPKRVRKVPKGMSEYQAAWIVGESDDEEGDEDEDSDEDGGEVEMQDVEEEEMVELVEEDHEAETESRRSVAFQDLDIEEEDRQLKSWRNRKREEEDDLAFPDEIDTPLDVPARTRFQRYRGLRSFRTSPWDPYENLPRDYARIFQFEDYKRTERAVKKRAEKRVATVEPGVRVTVYLKDVPKDAACHDQSSPFVLFSLMQHEHKKTVLHFAVQRNTEYDGSVRSKDSLILCVGPRRLLVNPIYSQHTRGGKGANNVHKFERYLRHGTTNIATTYGPAVFGKQPCVLLRETDDPQSPELVAMGSFLNPDTTRVIAKRIILTGHPFKVHKKTATVRYMLFNADDVNYFKPVQLYTKHGRTGHIRESLGTHGYFKAHFDGPINQMDTVCMSLYKRVYPKWSENWKEPSGGFVSTSSDAMEE